MTTPDSPEPEALYEPFTVTLTERHRDPSFYAGGVTLREVQITHPLATVEVVRSHFRIN